MTNATYDANDPLFAGLEDHPGLALVRSHNIQLKPLVYQLKIQTKDRRIARIGDVINWAQEDLLNEIETQINENNGSIRVIILKARQMGLSTIVEAVIFVLSVLYDNFQSMIISHESDSAEHILNMTKRYWDTYLFKDMHDEKYSARKQLSWSDLESNIAVATAKNTNAGRSKTLHALHASEVAFWDNPKALVSGLRQSFPSFGITMIALESTANGIGNYYHEQWVEAEAGRSEYKAKFYPWHLHPEYTLSYVPASEQRKYKAVSNPDEDELTLRSMGVNDARLLWRRYAIANLCGGSVDTFKQEYPATPHEAFLQTGRNVFRLQDIMKHYKPMPGVRGKLIDKPDNTVEFIRDAKGPLKIFRMPAKDINWGVYQIGADPTHTTVGDYACGQVISRRTLEQVAVFRRPMDPTKFGEEMARLGRFYNWAQIAPEKEGPGYATVGYLVGSGYPNIYESQKVDKTPGKVNHDVFGWGTNNSTKHLAISTVVAFLSEEVQSFGGSEFGVVLHDEDTFEELKSYVIDDKGNFANGSGAKFDDTVMAFAIALTTHKFEPALVTYSPDSAPGELARKVLELVDRPAVPGGSALPDRVQGSSMDWEEWK